MEREISVVYTGTELPGEFLRCLNARTQSLTIDLQPDLYVWFGWGFG
jgi:hypothetical protein